MEEEELSLEDLSVKEQARKIVEQLTVVKDEFIKNKDELAVSIRKDIVSTELKDILEHNKDYNSLYDAIKEYASKVLTL